VSDEQEKNNPYSEGDRSSELDSPEGVEPYDLDRYGEPESAPDSDIEQAASEAGEPIEDASSEVEPSSSSSPSGSSKKKASVGERVERWRAGAAGEGAALSRPGALGWKFFVVMGIGAMIAAVTLAVTNMQYAENANFWQKLGPGSLEALRVLLRAPVHLSIGMLAFAMTAWAVGVRAGKGDLAAARIGLAVSLAIMALQLQWGFPGQRLVAYLIAFVLYFTTVWLSFRCPPRVAGTLIAMHAGLFAAIAGLGWLIVWIGL